MFLSVGSCETHDNLHVQIHYTVYSIRFIPKFPLDYKK